MHIVENKLASSATSVFRRERYYPVDWNHYNSRYACNFCGVRAMHYKALSKHRNKYHDLLPAEFPTVELPLREEEQQKEDYWRKRRQKKTKANRYMPVN